MTDAGYRLVRQGALRPRGAQSPAPGRAPSASRSSEVLRGASLRTLERKIHQFDHLPVNSVVALSTLTLLSDHPTITDACFQNVLVTPEGDPPHRRSPRLLPAARDVRTPTSYLRTR